MNIEVFGQKIELKEDQYLISEDNEVVLKNGFLVELANIMKLPEPKFEIVPEGTDARAGVYLVRASMTHNGVYKEEWGEASPRNLKTDIAKLYPVGVARSRAMTKLLLKVLGLNGRAHNEDEVDKTKVKTPVKEEAAKTPAIQEKKAPAANEKKPETEKKPAADKKATAEKTTVSKATPPATAEGTPGGLTKEEAGEVVMTFGATKGVKVKDMVPATVKYLLGIAETRYNKNLIDATKIYHT